VSHITAIIAAGGRGLRLGGGRPKQLLAVDGRTVLERSVGAFLEHPSIDEVVVALPADIAAAPPPYLRSAGKPLRIVTGGARRQDSVANAFRAASPASGIIVIHDAARPFVSADLISRTIAAAVETGAALAAVGARDTVKRVDASLVRETLDRASIYLAQTPQAFTRAVLADALAFEGEATDEASLAERAGHPVRIVEGEASNIKITTPEDLEIAGAIARAAGRPARTGRAGLGYDLHRLVEGRALVLGGVVVTAEKGALGHSDADVVCHAATDAILGALCLGDIGMHFPDTDPRWKDARSLDLLRQAAAMAGAQGYEIGNLDVTVLLEAPKLRGHIDAVRSSLAAALGIDADRISVKAKTNEGVDAIGRGEAIAAQAIALLRRT
jgi:2-C-methyl-D-erythritol 4-phosphate cytidylyltransferase / 2-C-methyl-D-erythritol 2,4-cyclodiphosphate synthase